jgi:acyl-CoA thioester hydrolase
MLASLPYELPDLVTRAPLDTHRSAVLPEWVDWNGHMNVAFYVTAFDQGLKPTSPTIAR